MCIAFLYFNPKPTINDWKLVLISNRDEVFGRPSKPAEWDENSTFIAGRDLTANREGGTWLALGKSGKGAVILNVTQPKSSVRPGARPRGFLALNFVTGNQTCEEYMSELAIAKETYNAFNLLVFEKCPDSRFRAKFLGNKSDEGIQDLQAGIHGFSNSQNLFAPFQKVTHGLKSFQSVLLSHMIVDQEHRNEFECDLLNVLSDKTRHLPDPQLEKQACEYEADVRCCLSSVFVNTPISFGYGTRTQTVILIDGNDKVSFLERNRVNFEEEQFEWQSKRIEFELEN